MRWFSKRRGDARARRSRPTGSVARGTAPARAMNATARDRSAAGAVRRRASRAESPRPGTRHLPVARHNFANTPTDAVPPSSPLSALQVWRQPPYRRAMTDPLDPSAAHDHHVGLDLHDDHHHGMEKFELPNLDENMAHFPDFDDDDFGVPDMKHADALHANGDHHHDLNGVRAEMNGGAMARMNGNAMPPPANKTEEPNRVATIDRRSGVRSPVGRMDGDAAAEAVASGSHAGTAGTNLYDAQWSAEEQAVLERGMETYGADEYKSLWRYIKIAATLPAKGVRDVALRMRWMSRRAGKNGDGARGSKRKGVANGGGGDGDGGGKGGRRRQG